MPPLQAFDDNRRPVTWHYRIPPHQSQPDHILVLIVDPGVWAENALHDEPELLQYRKTCGIPRNGSCCDPAQSQGFEREPEREAPGFRGIPATPAVLTARANEPPKKVRMRGRIMNGGR